MTGLVLYPCDLGTGTPHQGWHDFHVTEHGVCCRFCGTTPHAAAQHPTTSPETGEIEESQP